MESATLNDNPFGFKIHVKQHYDAERNDFYSARINTSNLVAYGGTKEAALADLERRARCVLADYKVDYVAGSYGRTGDLGPGFAPGA